MIPLQVTSRIQPPPYSLSHHILQSFIHYQVVKSLPSSSIYVSLERSFPSNFQQNEDYLNDLQVQQFVL